MQEFIIDSNPIKNGKTQRLLAAAATALAKGKSVMIFTPPCDNDGRYNGIHYGDILKPFITGDATVQWNSYVYLQQKALPAAVENLHIFCDDAHKAKGDILIPRAYYAFRPGDNPAVTDPLWERWSALQAPEPSMPPPAPEEAPAAAADGLEGWESNVVKLNQRVTDALDREPANNGSVAFAVDALKTYLEAGELYAARVR